MVQCILQTNKNIARVIKISGSDVMVGGPMRPSTYTQCKPSCLCRDASNLENVCPQHITAFLLLTSSLPISFNIY